MFNRRKNQYRREAANRSRMPEDSVLFERVIPAVLVVLSLVMVVLILFAAGVLLGWIRF